MFKYVEGVFNITNTLLLNYLTIYDALILEKGCAPQKAVKTDNGNVLIWTY